jgi:hypothetical protein
LEIPLFDENLRLHAPLPILSFCLSSLLAWPAFRVSSGQGVHCWVMFVLLLQQLVETTAGCASCSFAVIHALPMIPMFHRVLFAVYIGTSSSPINLNPHPQSLPCISIRPSFCFDRYQAISKSKHLIHLACAMRSTCFCFQDIHRIDCCLAHRHASIVPYQKATRLS